MNQKINVGIICATKFCESADRSFGAYIDYMIRPEAVKKDNIEKFNLFEDYLNYMGDTKKLGSLWTKDYDEITRRKREELKEVFEKAREKGSNMWQTVISFDNRYLGANGLYDIETNSLNEKALRVAARKGIENMLKKEGLENAVWAAAFHYNTDNIHIHVAIVEPEPIRPKKIYKVYEKDRNGKVKRRWNEELGYMEKIPALGPDGKEIYKEGYKGTFKDSSLNGKGGIKSVIRSEIESNREETIAITNILREIVASKRERELMNEGAFSDKLKNLYEDLHKDSFEKRLYRNKWNYNQQGMRTYNENI